ncbi:MAG: hypothetical protein Q9216_002087 [Gyalolechia sp. 2 TL-2023]
MISGKSKETPRPFGQQRVRAEQNDHNDQGRQEASSDSRPGGVIEDLDQRDTSRRFRGFGDVADTEAYRDEEYETSHRSNVYGHDDCFRCLTRRLQHFFGHMRGRIVATHAKGALQETQYSGKSRAEPREVLKILKDEARRLSMVIAGQDRAYHNYECDHVPNQYTARDFIEEVRPKDVDGGATTSNQVGDKNSMPTLYLVAWKREVSLTQDEVGTDEVVGRSHCKNTCSCQSLPSTCIMTGRRESSPVIMNHPVTQLIPLAILGGANIATQEYCPPFVGKALQISANEYATARVKTQIPIQEYIMTGGPPDCTPMIKTLPSAVQLVTILKLKPIIPRRLKDRLSSCWYPSLERTASSWLDTSWVIFNLSLVRPASTDPSAAFEDLPLVRQEPHHRNIGKALEVEKGWQEKIGFVVVRIEEVG